MQPEDRAAGAVGLGGRAAVGPVRPSKVSPREWATMNHGGMPAAVNAPITEPGRGADDAVGAARVPAGLLGEGVQTAR